MIRGVVNARYEAVVVLTVHGSGGLLREIEAIIDTGFSGDLTLPRSVIASLGLRWREHQRVILANGAEDFCDVYDTTVTWDGQPQRILVEEAETSPLLGMRLLSGYAVRVEVLPGGSRRDRSAAVDLDGSPARPDPMERITGIGRALVALASSQLLCYHATHAYERSYSEWGSYRRAHPRGRGAAGGGVTEHRLIGAAGQPAGAG